jgi:hypothetical protein
MQALRRGVVQCARMRRVPLLALLLAAVVAGCGGGETQDQSKGSLPGAGKLRQQLEQATASTAADFPAVQGRTLQQVADALDGTGPQVGLATSVFTPGRNRLGFGVIDRKTGFVYGKTAVYVADGPGKTARGPYPAPADLLITSPAFRSRTAASEGDTFAAVYATDVQLRRSGQASVLVVTKVGDQLVGAGAAIRVVPTRRDSVVQVGAKAPRIDTDTRFANGGIKAVDTRVPPDDMHDVNLRDVLGKKPVALLFATPQLCQSRVCGPVVDVAEQLKQVYGDRMAFIHQEVYVDNDPNKGLRPPLRRFGLHTEPWLFVIDDTGRVTARLEGSFGFNAFKRALESGLQ